MKVKTSSAVAQPLAVDIETAAGLVGLSRAQFYRLFLKSKKLRVYKTGGRDRIIDYAELLAAYAAMRDELPQAELAETFKSDPVRATTERVR